ncbi:glycoside hydrolase family 43 protein [Pseudonocardia sp.]|uniref:glycoside hydrolase family 43 protein n=1 Tax=Pseudonocardia sp. TaxID=60912 RepID=UPI002F421EA9
MAAVVAATVAATPAVAIHPVISHDFPDPTLLVVGSTYYAYSTMSTYQGKTWHVPVARATSLTGTWTEITDAMPTLPPWVAKDPSGNGNVWAPEVAARSDGSYILYFTAHSGAKNVQCIGVALAHSPKGPFTSAATQPLVCRPEDVDSIDPKAFTDTDGKQYLLYTSGRGHATIWLQQVSTDGITPIGQRRALVQSDRADEANIVEAPTLVHHDDEYVLFYSGNTYNSGKYFVNYATASSLAATFVKHPGQFLNKATLGGKFNNPGGQDVVPGRSHDYLVFHAYTTPTQRSMFVVNMTWDDDGNPSLDLSNPVDALTATPQSAGSSNDS